MAALGFALAAFFAAALPLAFGEARRAGAAAGVALPLRPSEGPESASARRALPASVNWSFQPQGSGEFGVGKGAASKELKRKGLCDLQVEVRRALAHLCFEVAWQADCDPERHAQS